MYRIRKLICYFAVIYCILFFNIKRFEFNADSKYFILSPKSNSIAADNFIMDLRWKICSCSQNCFSYPTITVASFIEALPLMNASWVTDNMQMLRPWADVLHCIKLLRRSVNWPSFFILIQNVLALKSLTQRFYTWRIRLRLRKSTEIFFKSPRR